MPSLQRTIRSIYRVGVKEWWRQLQYIGDAKSGRLVGTDQCVNPPGDLSVADMGLVGLVTDILRI